MNGLFKSYPDNSIVKSDLKIRVSSGLQGLPWWIGGKKSACNAGDLGSIPGLGRSPGGGHGNPLQYSCLENSMDRGSWRAIVHGVTKSLTGLKRPSSSSSRLQFSPVAQSCPTLSNPMDCSMPGFPVHHQLPELAQTHVHWVSDAIQPSHPLLSPSPPAFNPSQHQGLFQ